MGSVESTLLTTGEAVSSFVSVEVLDLSLLCLLVGFLVSVLGCLESNLGEVVGSIKCTSLPTGAFVTSGASVVEVISFPLWLLVGFFVTVLGCLESNLGLAVGPIESSSLPTGEIELSCGSVVVVFSWPLCLLDGFLTFVLVCFEWSCDFATGLTVGSVTQITFRMVGDGEVDSGCSANDIFSLCPPDSLGDGSPDFLWLFCFGTAVGTLLGSDDSSIGV